MIMPRAPASWIVAIALSAVSGCATLDVSVDVYKGPMANTEDIRLEQLAALAVSTRPLLVDLRYQTERQRCSKENARQAYDSYESWDGRVWECLERCGYSRRKPFDIPVSSLQDPYAQKINAILTLFDDQKSMDENGAELGKFVELLRDARLKMSIASSVANKALKGKTTGDLFADRKNDLQALCKDTPEAKPSVPRYLDRNFAVHERALWDGKIVGIPFPEKQAQTASDRICQPAKEPAVFDTYHVTREAYELARALLPKEIKCDADDADGSSESARRKALVCAVQASIGANLKAANEGLRILSDTQMRSALSTGSLADVARATSAFVSPRILRLSGSRMDGSRYKDAVRVHRLLFGELKSDHVLQEKFYKAYRQTLTEALTAPRGGAGLADDLLRFEPELAEGYGDEFGLLTFPLPSPESSATLSDNFDAVIGSVSASLSSGSYGLDRGRAKHGLYTLVENYLAQNSPDDRGYRMVSHDLTEGLIHFAQKLVSLGDNDVLLQGDSSELEGKKYVRVLQATGNAIITNIDELTRSAHFRYDRERDLATAMVNGSLQALSLPPPATIDAFELAVKAAKLPGEMQTTLLGKAKSADGSLNEAETEIGKLRGQTDAKAEEARTARARFEQESACVRSLDFRAETDRDNAAHSKADAIVLVKKFAASCQPPLAAAQADELGSLLPEPFSNTGTWKEYLPKLQSAVDAKIDEQKKKLAAEESTIGKLDELLAMIPRLPSPLPFRPRAPDKTMSATAIWDELDATLQYLHVLHVSSYGNTAYVDRIKEAQTLVARYRSGALYLRPATSYLRNSYPAAALQPGASRSTANLLWPASLRTEPEEAVLQSMVDKQFWQNVNRVVVNGGGDVNYAVTKDDIGNWYVKGYSSDSEAIVKSMKNVALFATSAGARQTLAAPRTLAPDASKPANPGPQSQTVSGRQLKGFNDAYLKESEKIFRSLQKEAVAHQAVLGAALARAHPNAAAAVQETLTADAASFKNWIDKDAVAKALLLPDPDSEKSPKTAADFNAWTLELLEAMHAYTRDRADAIRKLPAGNFGPEETSGSPSEEETGKQVLQMNRDEQALFDADQQVRERTLDKRERSIENQRRALDILAGEPAS